MAQKLDGVRRQQNGYSTELTAEYMPNVKGPLIIIGSPERREKWDRQQRQSTGQFEKWSLQVIDAVDPVAEPFNLAVTKDVGFKLGDIIDVDSVEAIDIYCNNYRCVHHNKPDTYFRTANAKLVGHLDIFSAISEAMNDKKESL